MQALLCSFQELTALVEANNPTTVKVTAVEGPETGLGTEQA